jgi:hypothetical protein
MCIHNSSYYINWRDSTATNSPRSSCKEKPKGGLAGTYRETGVGVGEDWDSAFVLYVLVTLPAVLALK